MKIQKISVAILVCIILVSLATLLVRGAPGATSGQASQTVDGMPRFRVNDWEIAIATDPGTPMVGDNRLIITLRDARGNPASDVAIEAYAEMAAMGAMPAMRAPAGRLIETAPGRYEGEIDLSMRGEWPLTVQILDHPELGSRRLQFELATDREGLTIASGGLPVGGDAAGFSEEATFSIDNRRRQLIGVKISTVTHHDLKKTIRAVGRVTYDERLLSQVALKYDGYIGDLRANYVGAEVEEGDVLFTVYSPELLASQQEYLEALKRRGAASASNPLVRAARERLALWDITEGEIKALEERGTARRYVPIHAPRRGTVIERHVSDGSGVSAGHALLTIADLSRVWVEAEIYEADLSLIAIGNAANITLSYLPDQSFEAPIEYIYPYLNSATRTARVRLTLDNHAGVLKPDMYAEVALQAKLGHRLAVPEEAVIVAGKSRIVFVDLGGGALKPTKVITGRGVQGLIEIREGLALGDVIVTSGNFLVAAEARLKMGIQQW